jgi:hypothetical protein
MAHPTLIDVATRTRPMAGKKWIKKAVPASRKGVFKKKAEAAGMSTAAYAKKEAGASGALGKEARLAETLMGMHKKKSSSDKMYTHPRSQRG